MSAHNQRKTLLSVRWIWRWAFTEIIDMSVAFFTQKTFIYQKSDQQWKAISMPFQFCWLGCIFPLIIQERLHRVEKWRRWAPPTHHFYRLLPFTCLARCVVQIFLLLHHLGQFSFKTYPCPAILAPVEKTTFPFAFLHPSKHPQKADDLCQDNSQTRTVWKMLLLSSSQPWKNTFLCSCRECNSLKFVFFNI